MVHTLFAELDVGMAFVTSTGLGVLMDLVRSLSARTGPFVSSIRKTLLHV
jgi:hypothetical protein